MNKLYGSRVYLAGPMDRVADGGVGWRQYITLFLNLMDIIVLDPCNKPTDLAYENKEHRTHRQNLLDTNDLDKVSKQMKEIRRVDLRMVDVSDFLFVYWDMNTHMCGTLEEVFLANREKKPVLVMCEQGKSGMPHWMYGVLPHEYFFDSWNDLKDYLQKINTGPPQYTINGDKESLVELPEEVDKRWTLFDYEELMQTIMVPVVSNT